MIRAKLQQELKKWKSLREYLNSDGLQENAKDSIAELSLVDNHPADVGTETLNRAQDIAYRASLDESIERMEQALQKIDEGTYGLCDRCGSPISLARLQAKPEASLCIDCQRLGEQSEAEDINNRPLEEDVLNVPFARTFLDKADQTGFDGEDSWQAVARYGTSESPSDVPDAENYPDVYEDAGEERGIVQDVEKFADIDAEEW